VHSHGVCDVLRAECHEGLEGEVAEDAVVEGGPCAATML
jgi:hypothetical protein